MKTTELIIVGDIIASRHKFQPSDWSNFHGSLNKLNSLFAESLKIPLTVFAGDSFGAVCKDLKSAVQLILKIQELQQNYASRLVLVEDEVSFGIDKHNFNMLEGPALWKSQDMLSEIKKEDCLFISDLQDKLLTTTLNTIINLIFTIRANWESLEWEIYQAYKKNEKQKSIAKKQHISQQYVSKIVRQSKFKIIYQAEKNLNNIVDGFYHNFHSDL